MKIIKNIIFSSEMIDSGVQERNLHDVKIDPELLSYTLKDNLPWYLIGRACVKKGKCNSEVITYIGIIEAPCKSGDFVMIGLGSTGEVLYIPLEIFKHISASVKQTIDAHEAKEKPGARFDA